MATKNRLEEIASLPVTSAESCERALLAACIVAPEQIPTVGIEEDDLSCEKHKILWRTIRDIYELTGSADLCLIHDRLKATGLLKNVGGMAYVSEILDDVYSVFSAGAYAIQVKETALRRRLRELMLAGAEKASSVDVDEVVASILSLRKSWSSEQTATVYDAVKSLENGRSCIKLNSSLDSYLPAVGELCIIAARPSVGKTMLAVNLAEAYASAGHSVLFLSLEMSADAIQHRRISAATGIPAHDIRRRDSLTAGDWNAIIDASAVLAKRPIDVVHASYSPNELISAIETKCSSSNYKVIIVDHIGLISYKKPERRDIEIGDLTKDVASVSKRLGITTYCLCQLNRAIEGRQDKLPRMSDLRDSGRIEEDADIIWLLHRERAYYTDAAQDIDVIVAKNRNGPLGMVKLQANEVYGHVKLSD